MADDDRAKREVVLSEAGHRGQRDEVVARGPDRPPQIENKPLARDSSSMQLPPTSFAPL